MDALEHHRNELEGEAPGTSDHLCLSVSVDSTRHLSERHASRGAGPLRWNWAAVQQITTKLAAARGPDPTKWLADGDRTTFQPGLIKETRRRTNRPTFQQVLELTRPDGHWPVPKGLHTSVLPRPPGTRSG